MLTAKLVTTDNEILQIGALSNANLSTNISAEIKAKEAFVSWVYTPEILETLHAVAPSVVVMDGDTLAGYALTLTPECLEVYPAAAATYAHASTLIHNDLLLTEISVANPRSLKAHQKVGFHVIDTHHDPQGHWDAVLWDWT